MYVCLYACLSLCLSVNLSVCMHACMYECMYVYLDVCVCVYLSVEWVDGCVGVAVGRLVWCLAKIPRAKYYQFVPWYNILVCLWLFHLSPIFDEVCSTKFSMHPSQIFAKVCHIKLYKIANNILVRMSAIRRQFSSSLIFGVKARDSCWCGAP